MQVSPLYLKHFNFRDTPYNGNSYSTTVHPCICNVCSNSCNWNCSPFCEFPVVGSEEPHKILFQIVRVMKRSQNESEQGYLSYLTCFAGGVFLATCFLDIIPHIK